MRARYGCTNGWDSRIAGILRRTCGIRENPDRTAAEEAGENATFCVPLLYSRGSEGRSVDTALEACATRATFPIARHISDSARKEAYATVGMCSLWRGSIGRSPVSRAVEMGKSEYARKACG